MWATSLPHRRQWPTQEFPHRFRFSIFQHPRFSSGLWTGLLIGQLHHPPPPDYKPVVGEIEEMTQRQQLRHTSVGRTYIRGVQAQQTGQSICSWDLHAASFLQLSNLAQQLSAASYSLHGQGSKEIKAYHRTLFVTKETLWVGYPEPLTLNAEHVLLHILLDGNIAWGVGSLHSQDNDYTGTFRMCLYKLVTLCLPYR